MRTWTLHRVKEHPFEDVVIEGPTIEGTRNGAGDVRVIELGPVLDLLEEVVCQGAGEGPFDDAEVLLREHGRLPV